MKAEEGQAEFPEKEQENEDEKQSLTANEDVSKEKPSEALVAEDIQAKLFEQIQPRIEEVFKRLRNAALPNSTSNPEENHTEEEHVEEEHIEDEQAKHFMGACFQSQDALDELKSILQELEFDEAFSMLEHLPQDIEEEEPEPPKPGIITNLISINWYLVRYQT